MKLRGEENDFTQMELQISTGSCLRKEYGSWCVEREERERRKVVLMQGRCLMVCLNDIASGVRFDLVLGLAEVGMIALKVFDFCCQ